MKAIIWKELRENVRWLPVGLFVVGVVCYMAHPSRNGSNALLATALVNYFAIVAPLLAFALGVVQAYRDLQPAAGAYLNHRSVTASDVFLAKVFSGFVLYMVSVIVPLVALAAWVAYRGMWFYPMRPAQVIPGLVFAMIAFAMHPAAMLMMSRGASWWGTRLFPLIPAGAALVPFYAYLGTGGLYGAMVCIAIAVPALSWMVAIARQGWQELASDPPAASVNPTLSRRWLLPTYVLVGSTMCIFFAIVFAITTIENASRSNVYVPSPYTTLAVEENSDDLWLITTFQEYDVSVSQYKTTTIGGENVTNGAKVNLKSAAGKNRAMNEFGTMFPLQDYNGNDGFFTSLNSMPGGTLMYSYDSRGYLIAYESYPQLRWVKTLAADGVHPAGELIGTPFDGDPIGNGMLSFRILTNTGYPTPLIDSNGLSFIDTPIAIRRIIDIQTDGATLVPSRKGDAPRVIVLSGTELHEFKLIDASGTDDWYEAPEPGSNAYNRVNSKILQLGVEPIRKFTLPASFIAKDGFSLAWTPESVYVSESLRINNWIPVAVYRLKPDGTTETISFSVDPGSLPKSDDDKLSLTIVIAGMIPGGVIISAVAFASYLVVIGEAAPSDPFQEIGAHPITTSTFAVSYLVVTALSFWLARRAAYRRGLSRRQTTLWSWSVSLLGLAAPLSIIAIYRLVYREPCPRCPGLRRIDTKTCEHCSAQWEPRANEGIEISDRQSPRPIEPMALLKS